MEAISDWIRLQFGLTAPMQERLLSSLILVFILWVVRRVVIATVVRTVKDPTVRYRWRKITLYVAVFIGFIGIAGIWSSALRGVATFLGLLSAGLAIALKDILSNMAGWVFIVWRKPFDLGDRIELDGVAGDVVDIRLFQFTLLEIGHWADADQTTGRLIHIPNQQVLVQGVANYTRGFQYLWDEIGVLVTFESDWRKAKQILLEVAERRGAEASEVAAAQIARASERFLISSTSLAPAVYTSVRDSGVQLTLRYITHARRRRVTAEAVWEDVLVEFAQQDDIDFAYPTVRYYDNPIEGKSGTKPPGPAPRR